MSRLREGWERVRAWVQRRDRDADFDDELQAHLRLAADDFEAQGFSPAEAHRRAAHALGAVESARAGHRDARGLPRLDSVLADIGYAARRLRKAPAFALVVIAILGRRHRREHRHLQHRQRRRPAGAAAGARRPPGLDHA